MAKFIMVGCDLHDKTMLLKVACDRGEAETIRLLNTRAARERMIVDLKARAAAAGAPSILFAYEASGQGFGLYDELTAAGLRCHVLAPTKISRSTQQKGSKTDEKDALDLLQLLRAHVLAGNPLPNVWIPDLQTRDHREAVRCRLDAAEKITGLKAQIKSLLKRHGLTRPESTLKGWTRLFAAWLRGLCEDPARGPGLRTALASLVRQLESLEKEVKLLDEALAGLANSARYQAPVARLVKLSGVGVLTALVFLTEVGEAARFANRRQISAYLGLVPKCYESGSANDRKGHITRQGSSRVRKVLCQAVWARVRSQGADQDVYERIVAKNPKHKKIAAVAVMRRLAVRMWHEARGDEPQREGPLTERRRSSAPVSACAEPHCQLA
jgi:transposase